MSQSIERQLSDEDYQLIEAHHLGTPLAIYRLKRGPILCLYSGGIFFLAVGIAVPIYLIVSSVMGWHKTQPNDTLVLLQLIGWACCSLLVGFFLLRVVVPHAWKKHIIACEDGLLQVEKQIWRQQVEVIHWHDILTIKKLLNEYTLMGQEGKMVSLDKMYQNINMLVALIKTRIGEG